MDKSVKVFTFHLISLQTFKIKDKYFSKKFKKNATRKLVALKFLFKSTWWPI